MSEDPLYAEIPAPDGKRVPRGALPPPGTVVYPDYEEPIDFCHNTVEEAEPHLFIEYEKPIISPGGKAFARFCLIPLRPSGSYEKANATAVWPLWEGKITVRPVRLFRSPEAAAISSCVRELAHYLDYSLQIQAAVKHAGMDAEAVEAEALVLIREKEPKGG